MTMLCRELTIDELLGDPVIQAVMQADRVDPLALRVTLHSVAIEIESAWRQSDDSAPESRQAPSGRNAFSRWTRSLTGRSAPSGHRGAGSDIRSQLCGGR
jgi:hypothetical protein